MSANEGLGLLSLLIGKSGWIRVRIRIKVGILADLLPSNTHLIQ